ncbi:hypothetical protein VNO77_20900 [Canavalia gladiata]|uniref:Uncharacterized protein n=1 Tax=Canavalia gladiata TaxID=3824 RepID=A0AAN9QR07_CANGL
MEEPPPSIVELVMSLQQATFMAKQLSSTTNPTHLHQIHSSLHHAHRHLSSFLSTAPPPPATENSVSSANGAAPMQVEDGGGGGGGVDEETTSKCTIDRVEEKMRDCFIKNKRPKRPLSPSAAAFIEEKRLADDGFLGRDRDYDPYATRLRTLDLVYHFRNRLLFIYRLLCGVSSV